MRCLRRWCESFPVPSVLAPVVSVPGLPHAFAPTLRSLTNQITNQPTNHKAAHQPPPLHLQKSFGQRQMTSAAANYKSLYPAPDLLSRILCRAALTGSPSDRRNCLLVCKAWSVAFSSRKPLLVKYNFHRTEGLPDGDIYNLNSAGGNIVSSLDWGIETIGCICV
ncbi:uncharacterized protein EV422DRAFT_283990 [Fimicolochytrium jonesii]|uniref:uncharacterized protein n=1 Tax=Fimicolochytrium jonesii TaxID=1396493 RepID=UPI0022FEB523|nr:uncharacterized protein EV422DRAFT_283990 [Fimicolochytrium jonesii]KAI8816481.1 hypothetical protein EV422DRAFT_283990 [Fimicolochytrium jonesii]